MQVTGGGGEGCDNGDVGVEREKSEQCEQGDRAR